MATSMTPEEDKIIDYYWGRCLQFFHTIWYFTHISMDGSDKDRRICVLGCATCDQTFWIRSDIKELVRKERERQRIWKNQSFQSK